MIVFWEKLCGLACQTKSSLSARKASVTPSAWAAQRVSGAARAPVRGDFWVQVMQKYGDCHAGWGPQT